MITALAEQSKKTSRTIRELKDNDEDFEWYPTTDEIIAAVNKDMRIQITAQTCTILDIGAGNGGTISKLTPRYGDNDNVKVVRHAIEKSRILIQELPPDVFVLGTDFHEQSLVDKPVTVTFCNPPYSEYEHWAARICRETRAKVTYLVIPDRWRNNPDINEAIEARGLSVKSLGFFDFHNAERKARANVEVIALRSYGGPQRHSRNNPEHIPNVDPFDAFLRENLDLHDAVDVEKETQKERIDTAVETGLALGRNIVDVLCDQYYTDLERLFENYRAIGQLDPVIRQQLQVSVNSILEAVKSRISGIKKVYWRRLFDEMQELNSKLDIKRREEFSAKMSDDIPVDFTPDNVYGVVVWLIKNANEYFDVQLVDLYRKMSEKANVVNYKSNQRIWEERSWRYQDEEFSHYKLEYRMVLEWIGGISTSQWSWDHSRYNRLTEGAHNFLSDVCTVANNLGFDNDASPMNFEWESRKKCDFKTKDGETLMSVRAFKNRNLHIKFNQKFMLALNVEAGRLLGWIRNPAEACDELAIPPSQHDTVAEQFSTTFHLPLDPNVLKLTHSRNNSH